MAKFLGNFESGSPEWNELRSGAITGTLFGTICGLNTWESPFTAWAKATGKIPDEVKQSRPMRLGQLLEPVVKQIWMEENPGYIIVSDIGTWQHDEYDWARANPDGILRYPDDTEGILEVKTSRIPFDEVPPHYEAQMLWYMWIMGLHKGKLIALFSGNDLQTFDVEFDQFKFDAMFSAVLRWREYVATETKPDWDGSNSTYETVKKLNLGTSDDEVDLGDLGIHLGNAQSDFDKAAEHLTEMKSRTIDALGDAKYGVTQGVTVAVRSVNKNGVVSLTIKKGIK